MPEYHGWTHARKEDGGTDPIPLPETGAGPYAVMVWDDGATIADDTPTTLASLTDFTKAYVSDPSLIDVNLTNGSIILDTTEGPGADTVPGLWLATIKVTWSGNFAADLWATINWTMGTAWVFDEVQARAFYAKAQNTASMTLTEHCEGSSMVIVYDNGSGNNRVTGSLKQVSGGNQTLEQVVLSVVRLDTYPATNGVLLP